jgi:hypothetical protein
MQFECEVRLADGVEAVVVGEAEILDRCDCGGEFHTHIEAIHIESAILLTPNGDEWLEAAITSELEDAVEAQLYAELAEAA